MNETPLQKNQNGAGGNEATETILIAGGVALVVLGTGLIMTHPGLRKMATAGITRFFPELEKPLQSGIAGLLPDVERYLKLRSM